MTSNSRVRTSCGFGNTVATTPSAKDGPFKKSVSSASARSSSSLTTETDTIRPYLGESIPKRHVPRYVTASDPMENVEPTWAIDRKGPSLI